MNRAVRRLSPEDAPSVVDVFCDAFRDYPVMRWVVGSAGEVYEARLRSLIGFFVAARALKGEPLFGVEVEGRLVAAATASFSGKGEVPPSLDAVREATWSELGPEARARYERCGVVWRSFEVEGPHTHLNMIGVRPAQQGTGLAALLLAEVHELSRTSPGSSGVTLTTENPANVPFYQKAGYQVIGRAAISPDLETWGFFRPEPLPR